MVKKLKPIKTEEQPWFKQDIEKILEEHSLRIDSGISPELHTFYGKIGISVAVKISQRKGKIPVLTTIKHYEDLANHLIKGFKKKGIPVVRGK